MFPFPLLRIRKVHRLRAVPLTRRRQSSQKMNPVLFPPYLTVPPKRRLELKSLRKNRKPQMTPPIRTGSRNTEMMYPSPPIRLLRLRTIQALPVLLPERMPMQMNIPVRSTTPCSAGLKQATPHKITWIMTVTSTNRSAPWEATKQNNRKGRHGFCAMSFSFAKKEN